MSMFCKSLFVLLSFFFWPLRCLSFFDVIKKQACFVPVQLSMLIVLSYTYYVVFFVLFIFILCTQCYRFLWNVRSWLPLWFSFASQTSLQYSSLLSVCKNVYVCWYFFFHYCWPCYRLQLPVDNNQQIINHPINH